MQKPTPIQKDLFIKVQHKHRGGNAISVLDNIRYDDGMTLIICDERNNKLYTMNNEKNDKKHENNITHENNKYFNHGAHSAVYVVTDNEGNDFILKLLVGDNDILIREYNKTIKNYPKLQQNLINIFYYGMIQYENDRDRKYGYTIVQQYGGFEEIQKLNIGDKIKWIMNMMDVLIELFSESLHWNDFKPANVGMDGDLNCVILDFDTNTLISNRSFQQHYNLNPPVLIKWYKEFYDRDKRENIAKLNTYMIAIIVFMLIYDNLYRAHQNEDFQNIYIDNVNLYQYGACDYQYSSYQLDNLYFKLINKNVNSLPFYNQTRDMLRNIFGNIKLERKLNANDERSHILRGNAELVADKKGIYNMLILLINKSILGKLFDFNFSDFTHKLEYITKNIQTYVKRHLEHSSMPDNPGNVAQIDRFFREIVVPELEYYTILANFKTLYKIIDGVKFDEAKYDELSRGYFRDRVDQLIPSGTGLGNRPDGMDDFTYSEIRHGFKSAVAEDLQDAFKRFGYNEFKCLLEDDREAYKKLHKHTEDDYVDFLFYVHDILSLNKEYTKIMMYFVVYREKLYNLKTIVHPRISRELTHEFERLFPLDQHGGNHRDYNIRKQHYTLLKNT
jgi:hypothetical protein